MKLQNNLFFSSEKKIETYGNVASIDTLELFIYDFKSDFISPPNLTPELKCFLQHFNFWQNQQTKEPCIRVTSVLCTSCWANRDAQQLPPL